MIQFRQLMAKRKAIVEHIQKAEREGNKGTSPWTRQEMTISDLFSVPPDWLSTLKESIENGTFQGDLAQTWKQKNEWKYEWERLLEKANQGNVEAMEKVAASYRDEDYGVTQDKAESFKWYTRLYENHRSVIGMTYVGDMLAFGEGVKKNKLKGQNLLFMAAHKGCNYAAFCLGKQSSCLYVGTLCPQLKRFSSCSLLVPLC